MIPLAIHKRVWTWFRVCPVDERTSNWKKLASTIFTLFAFLSVLSIIPVSSAYVYKFILNDLEGSLHALFELIGFTRIT